MGPRPPSGAVARWVELGWRCSTGAVGAGLSASGSPLRRRPATSSSGAATSDGHGVHKLASEPQVPPLGNRSCAWKGAEDWRAATARLPRRGSTGSTRRRTGVVQERRRGGRAQARWGGLRRDGGCNARSRRAVASEGVGGAAQRATRSSAGSLPGAQGGGTAAWKLHLRPFHAAHVCSAPSVAKISWLSAFACHAYCERGTGTHA